MQTQNRKQIHWIALVITKSCECVAQDVRFSQALDINKAPTSDSGSEFGLRKPEPWQEERVTILRTLDMDTVLLSDNKTNKNTFSWCHN